MFYSARSRFIYSSSRNFWKKAVDLSKERAKYSKDPQNIITPIKIIFARGLSTVPPRKGVFHNNQLILESRFDGLYVCCGSMQGETYKTQPLTLVVPSYDSFADLICHDLGTTTDLFPDKFGGISGGEMWQLAFSGTNGVPEKID